VSRTSTDPNSPKSALNVSPEATAGGTTQVPVVTNWPASMPSLKVYSSLAIQVSAARGSPSTLAPVPLATGLPLR
jgi:hypothetical protein